MKINQDNWRLFRIKTLEEFGGKRPNHFNGAGKMDWMYGKRLVDILLNPEAFDLEACNVYKDDETWVLDEERDCIKIEASIYEIEE
jgi:hypothetical protein